MKMFGSFSSILARVLGTSNDDRKVVWLTLRDLEMTMPGGVVVSGFLSNRKVAEGFHRVGVARAWLPGPTFAEERVGIFYEVRKHLVNRYKAAARAAAKYEADYGLSLNPLDRLAPVVIQGRKTLVVIAFREEEARAALEQRGIALTA